MSQILGLKFREYGQVYYFESGPFVVNPSEHVIVTTDQGMGLAQVVMVRDDAPEELGGEELKPIYRLANDEDLEKQRENDALGREAFEFCRQCIRERDLEMKLVDVEVFYDRGKIIFYFTAPNRIDFRELVKDLVKTYRTRIELRQIGVRHETQMIGAVGNCGQLCCCRRFLRKFAPVTIKMAKEQNLFLNPAKISGICGRLLCCLSYEQENYENFHRQCPKIGKKYQTDNGGAKVLRANLFRNTLSLIVDGGEEKEVTLEEWSEMHPRRPSVNQQPGQQQSQQQGQQQDGQDKSQSRGRQQDKQKGRPAKPSRQKGRQPKPDNRDNRGSRSGRGGEPKVAGSQEGREEQNADSLDKPLTAATESSPASTESSVPSYDVMALQEFHAAEGGLDDDHEASPEPDSRPDDKPGDKQEEKDKGGGRGGQRRGRRGGGRQQAKGQAKDQAKDQADSAPKEGDEPSGKKRRPRRKRRRRPKSKQQSSE